MCQDLGRNVRSTDFDHFENQMRMCRCCANGAHSNWISKCEGKPQRLSRPLSIVRLSLSVQLSRGLPQPACGSFYRTSVIHLRSLSAPQGNSALFRSSPQFIRIAARAGCRGHPVTRPKDWPRGQGSGPASSGPRRPGRHGRRCSGTLHNSSA